MANLHKYVPSSDKTGYYLFDYINGQNVTYQVTSLAEQILKRLGYTDGDSLPREIFYTLHRFDLIYTNKSGVEPPNSLSEIPNLEEPQLQKDADRNEFFNILLEVGEFDTSEKEDLERYLETSDLSPSTNDASGTGESAGSWRPEKPNDTDLYRGTVDFFNDTGGYGFISCDSLEDDVFYHMEDVGGRDIQEGTELEFVKIEAEKGPRATHVRFVSNAPPNSNLVEAKKSSGSHQEDDSPTETENWPPFEEFRKAREYDSHLEFQFLGTGSLCPTADRLTNSLVVKRGSKSFLFDVGEGAQHRMRQQDVCFDIDAIFVSSPDLESIDGLGPLMRTLSLEGRETDIQIIVPPRSIDIVRSILDCYGEFGFTIEISEAVDGPVYEDEEFEIRSFGYEQNTEKRGFVFEEVPRRGRYYHEKIKEVGAEQSQIAKWMDGRDPVVSISGREVDLRSLVADPTSGRKFMITSKIDDVDGLAPHMNDLDLLIYNMDSIIGDSDCGGSKGCGYWGKIAQNANISKPIFTKLNPEVQPNNSELLNEVKSNFDEEVHVASDRDSMSLTVPGSKPHPDDLRDRELGDPVTMTDLDEGMYIFLRVDREKDGRKALSRAGSVHITNGVNFVDEKVIVRIDSVKSGYVVASIENPPDGTVVRQYKTNIGGFTGKFSLSSTQKPTKKKKKQSRKRKRPNPFRGSSETMRDLVRKKY